MVSNVNNKVIMGQGEYIVFHELSTKEIKPLSKDIYEKANKILQEYSPASIINREVDLNVAEEKCSRRYELMREKIKLIDPSLEIAFIPKTLYELFFIRKCIKEDLKQKDICFYISPGKHLPEYPNPLDTDKLKRKCWHVAFFKDSGDNNDPGVKEIAYRLNCHILKHLRPTSQGFTQQELSTHLKDKIVYLKNYHQKCHDLTQNKIDKDVFLPDFDENKNRRGPTANFGFENCLVMPMGIRDNSDGAIIQKAMDLDCSKEAQNSFILYRGAHFQDDSISSDNNCCHSLSYGTSLFAGCIYDAKATAFHYMRANENDAYAIQIPFKQLNNSPFYIPPTNTICQLFGYGEFFHSRTKAWKDFPINKVGGIQDGGVQVEDFVKNRNHLISNLSRDELLNQFGEYKKKAIQLKFT